MSPRSPCHGGSQRHNLRSSIFRPKHNQRSIHAPTPIEGSVGSVTADGAYDGDVVYDAVLRRHPAACVIIPPRATAVVSDTGTTQRDEHLRTIAEHGRLGWQRRSGYSRRSLVETAMYRYKTIIGRRLHARTLPNQKTEAKLGCNVLNRMTNLGMPVSVRIK